MDDDDDLEYGHETILQAVIWSLLNSEALDGLCITADTAVLIDGDGEPVTLDQVYTYADAGILSLNKGVWIELSDGSRFGLTITVASRGRGDTTIRPPH